MPKRIKVLIVDDHPVVISGCQAVLPSKQFDVSEAANATQGLQQYNRHRPSVALIDIDLPDVSGFDLLRRIRKSNRDANVLMFGSGDDAALVVRSIELGAKGFISKAGKLNELARAISIVAEGNVYIAPAMAAAVATSGASVRANPAATLDPREFEILRLLAKGRKIAEIADALDISYKTVANRTSMLKQRIGAKSHSDLIRMAYELTLD